MTEGIWNDKKHSLVVLSGGVLSIALQDSFWVVMAGSIGMGALLFSKRMKRFGLANTITTTRLLLLLVVIFLSSVIDTRLTGAALIVVLVLDGVDGYVARRRNEQSEFGGRLDMETDALFAALTTTLLFVEFEYSILILIPGYLSYLFVWIKLIFGVSDMPAPEMPWVKHLAVAFFISLVTPFLLPERIAMVAVWIGCALVTISFGQELILLLKAKK